MSDFPKLKTGAVIQYPTQRTQVSATKIFRFVDGGEQRFRDFTATTVRWTIRLDLLTETEAEALDQFFQSQQGRFGSFTFTDPWDGTTYPDCSFEGDSFTMTQAAEGRASVNLVVRRN